MNVSAIKDLLLHEPLGECHLKEFSNTKSSVNPSRGGAGYSLIWAI